MIKRLSSHWLVILLLLLVVALGVVAAGRLTAQAVRAAPHPGGGGPYVCTPVEVAVFINRVHIKCTIPYTATIWYFAYPTSDSAGASRFLSLFETAKATGATVSVFFDPLDLTGNTFGCGNGDCRRITGATSP